MSRMSRIPVEAHKPDIDFLTVGPAMHILQLNVVGFSPAKRSIIWVIAERHNVNDICLTVIAGKTCQHDKKLLLVARKN